ncbi:hypothetical protein FHG66_21195 [Rubellimicrobium rubrum]|uniref:Uncharacterized protein n=1 Tax=Rubellimicrobium rubrum TaxID=2585369 RepID=A0A5C4ML35_9RHOB|nr:hypothetical protein [Rubellimicrobium rubrum]TNC43079.1 hypothetical protein FHG66_21195 [Rubellimicrobium rubrum]
MTGEHFVPEHVYDRLALELEVLAVHLAVPGSPDPETWAIELLSLANIWPDSVTPTLDCAPNIVTA